MMKNVMFVLVMVFGLFMSSVFTGICQAALKTRSVYAFDGNGYTQLTDSGPISFNAKKYGSPDTVAGVTNNAFKFVPLTDNSDCEALYTDWDYDLNQGFEISLWFNALKADQKNPYPRLMELPGRFVMSIINNANFVEFSPIGPGTPPKLQSSAGFNDGNWHHVVVIYDGTNKNATMYIDGTEEASTNFGSTTFNIIPPSGTGDDKLWFASPNAFISKTRGLEGMLDEVTIKGLTAFTTHSMYHFNDTGSVQLVDSGIIGYDATKYSTPDTVTGKFGTAFKFIPLSDNSDCEALYTDWDYDLNQGFEISLWFNALAADQKNPYPRLMELPGRFVMSIINNANFVEFSPIGPGTPPKLQSSAGFNDGNWHHVVVIYDGTNKNATMYIDNTEEVSANFGSATFNINPPSGTGNDKLWFASQNAFSSKTRGLEGMLDEVSIRGLPIINKMGTVIIIK